MLREIDRRLLLSDRVINGAFVRVIDLECSSLRSLDRLRSRTVVECCGAIKRNVNFRVVTVVDICHLARCGSDSVIGQRCSKIALIGDRSLTDSSIIREQLVQSRHEISKLFRIARMLTFHLSDDHLNTLLSGVLLAILIPVHSDGVVLQVKVSQSLQHGRCAVLCCSLQSKPVRSVGKICKCCIVQSVRASLRHGVCRSPIFREWIVTISRLQYVREWNTCVNAEVHLTVAPRILQLTNRRAVIHISAKHHQNSAIRVILIEEVVCRLEC